MSVRVSPTNRNPTHDLALIIKGRRYGLILDGGPQSIGEIPLPSTTTLAGRAQGKFGDYEPGLTHIEQRNWNAGRGSDDFSSDSSRFFDSRNCFSMVPNKLFPSPKWYFGTGIRTTHEYFSDSLDWQRLTGSHLYISSTFTVGGSNLSADNLEFWVRRIGTPGTLTAEIWSDSAGDPSAVVASATDTVTTSTITDGESVYYTFDLSAASDLSASTAYHVVLYGASTDDAANHWEVGVDTTGSASKSSANGSTWAAAGYSVNFRVSDTDIGRKWHFFEMSGALYATDERDDGSTTNKSKLYMNGERGRATSATSTTLVDTNNGMDGSWVDDQWNNWYIKIIAGTGKGQWRKITDTSASGNSVTVAAWDVNPDSTSDYVIYGGAAWQNITPASGDLIDDKVVDVAVFDTFAVFAERSGATQLALLLRYNGAGSPPAHQTDDAPADDRCRVDLLHTAHDPVDGPQLWFGRNANMTVTRMNSFTWGSPAASDISSAISVGGDSWEMRNIIDYDGQIYIPKLDGMYTVANDRTTKLNIGIDVLRDDNNGEAMVVHDSLLYFSWGGYAVIRMVGRDVASIGPDRGTGMLDGRSGPIVALASHPNHLWACLDGGASNTSSLLAYDNASFGWHEVFSGWRPGKRLRNVYMQSNPGTRPRLWLSVNGDILYQDYPKGTMNPLEDSGLVFQHEAVLTMSDIDMGSSQLPKFFKEVNLISENLTPGIEVHFEYQADKDIGGANWVHAGTFYASANDTIPLDIAEVKRLRCRLRMLTNAGATPPVIKAVVLEGYARTPLKYRYPFRARVSSNQPNKLGQKDENPDDLVAALKEASKSAEKVILESRWKQMHKIEVKVAPISVRRDSTNSQTGDWTGTIEGILEEA